MLRANKGIVRGRFLLLLVGSLLGIGSGRALADESLLIYPSVSAVFEYDPARYSVLSTSDPSYAPAFGVAWFMLWDDVEARVPTEIYRAPSIARFEPSARGENRFVVYRNEFNLVIDGFSGASRNWGNLYIRFIPEPNTTPPQVEFDGVLVSETITPVAGFAASTPTGDGHFFDTRVHHVRWSGALGLRIVVFSDRNFNRAFDDGPPLFSVVAQDAAAPTRATSWGSLKSPSRQPQPIVRTPAWFAPARPSRG